MGACSASEPFYRRARASGYPQAGEGCYLGDHDVLDRRDHVRQALPGPGDNGTTQKARVTGDNGGHAK
jgi:hypothetical protein